MRAPSDQSKIKEGRGTGTHASYKPWIKTREFNSKGTCANPIDWITGRVVELLSQGEMQAWYMLRFDEEIDDINEQFPLDRGKVNRVCERYNIRKPIHILTSDFLVTFKDGRKAVYSVKSSKDEFDTKGKSEKEINHINNKFNRLFIEKMYWEEELDIPYHLIFKDNFNTIYYNNIRAVSKFYNEESVFDNVSYLKHLIVTHKINIEKITEEQLDFVTLAEQLLEGEHNYEQLKNRSQQYINI